MWAKGIDGCNCPVVVPCCSEEAVADPGIPEDAFNFCLWRFRIKQQKLPPAAKLVWTETCRELVSFLRPERSRRHGVCSV